MSVYDTEIAKSIWHGKLPIKVSLDPTEIDVYGNHRVWEPIYLQVSRCSYLPLVTQHIQNILKELGMQVSNASFESVWYDFDQKPLKWHYPIGLLFDLHTDASKLPWALTMHFKDLPSDKILLKPTPDTMQDMFMSMVKEADFLCHGSTKKVMNLSKRDTTQLWQSLASDQYDAFRTVNQQLVEYSSQMKGIPLRIYLPDQCPVIQDLVSFHQTSSSEIPTISQVITKVIPTLDQDTLTELAVITHGIQLPLDTPIHWAYENLIFADNFLHFVIRVLHNKDVI